MFFKWSLAYRACVWIRILWFAPQGPTHHNYRVAQPGADQKGPSDWLLSSRISKVYMIWIWTELDINGFERTSIRCFFTLVPSLIVVEHMMILFFSTRCTCLLLIFSNWEGMSGLVKGKELSIGQCPTTTTEWHTFHQAVKLWWFVIRGEINGQSLPTCLPGLQNTTTMCSYISCSKHISI